MHINILKIKLILPEVHDLKSKRRIIKSLVSKIRNHYNAAVAEIDSLDKWQTAELGIVCVSDDKSFLASYASQIMDYIQQRTQGDFYIADHQQELISGV